MTISGYVVSRNRIPWALQGCWGFLQARQAGSGKASQPVSWFACPGPYKGEWTAGRGISMSSSNVFTASPAFSPPLFWPIHSPSHAWKPLMLNFSPPWLKNLSVSSKWLIVEEHGFPVNVWVPSSGELGNCRPQWAQPSVLHLSRSTCRVSVRILLTWLYLSKKATMVFVFGDFVM